ncbi:MAG: hypothetical protein Q4C20_01215 [Erysipelotrichaceae bacterium]|nr:hypothetical protein [Erysipelotrichaceae bacterium]
MSFRNVLLHNSLTEKIAYKQTNQIKIGESAHFHMPESKSRNNKVDISGKNNEVNISDGQTVHGSVIHIAGESNKIQIGLNSNTYDFSDNSIRILGNRNTIEIEDGTRLTSCNLFICGDDNLIHIGKDCSLMLTGIHMEQNCNQARIDEGCTFHGRDLSMAELVMDEGTSIVFKKDCMVSNDVKIRSSDSHSIVDSEGHRLNPAADITIAEHTWICFGSIILKGFANGKNTVIAAGSLCTKPIADEHVIIGGNPAKVIKREVDWDRKFVK